MARPFSAYSILELEPGADRAAIEAAYRRLIKLHHPDRHGGDGGRAAEINRAYRELRSSPALEPIPAARPRRSRGRRRRSRRFPRWILVAGGLLVIALMQRDALMKQGRALASRLDEMGVPVAAPASSSNIGGSSLLDDPIHSAAVADSINEALRLVKTGNQQALVEHSRDCHRKLRLKPALPLLDRCAAYDSAVAALQDLDPDRDMSSFNASSVTARQLTAASLFSGDYLAIERRLNRIRSQVELALMPPAPPQLTSVTVEPENIALEVEP